jgi:hypothetical protein
VANRKLYITVCEIRHIIREALGGSQPDETYSVNLLDDPSIEKHSVYVPDDIKVSIKKWAKDMGLSKNHKS